MGGPSLRVLVGLECSGVIREAFRSLGHDAWSCDLKPAEDGSRFHIEGDVRDQLDKGWHLAVLHPPCTRLANSGVRWLSDPPLNKTLEQVWEELAEGANLFSVCLNAPIECIAVENPVMHRHAKRLIQNYRPADQSVQPWQFGAYHSGPDNQRKRTCWWLKNLRPLRPLGVLDGSTARDSVWRMSEHHPDRAAARARTFPGMGAAIADQWSADAVRHHHFAPAIRRAT